MKQLMLENAKALIAFLSALGTWGYTALAEDGISGPEWFGLTGVVVAGLTVWYAHNAPTEEELTELAAWKLDPEAGQTQGWVPLLLVFIVAFILGALCYANGIIVGD